MFWWGSDETASSRAEWQPGCLNMQQRVWHTRCGRQQHHNTAQHACGKGLLPLPLLLPVEAQHDLTTKRLAVTIQLGMQADAAAEAHLAIASRMGLMLAK